MSPAEAWARSTAPAGVQTKAVVERMLIVMKARMETQPSKRGSWRGGTLRHFGLVPEQPVNPFLAEQPASPAVRHFIVLEEPFEIGGDYFMVDRVIPSGADPQTDVLILEGYEHADGVERSSRRALQMRDLEALIMDDRVSIPFVSTARKYNLDHGWANGGRTLASLGIVLGRDAG